MALNAIKKDNTHYLFIRTITTVRPNEDIKEVEKRLDQFVREMMITSLDFIEKKKVKN